VQRPGEAESRVFFLSSFHIAGRGLFSLCQSGWGRIGSGPGRIALGSKPRVGLRANAGTPMMSSPETPSLQVLSLPEPAVK